MPTVSPTPMFRGIAILIDFQPSIRDARIVHAGVHALVRRLEDRQAHVDELVGAIPPLVARYGLAARLVGRSAGVVKFTLTDEGIR